MIYSMGAVAVAHSLLDLLMTLEELGVDVSAIRGLCRELDRHYIPSRYPNAYVSGYPSLYYDEETGARGLRSARKIVEWVRDRLAR